MPHSDAGGGRDGAFDSDCSYEGSQDGSYSGHGGGGASSGIGGVATEDGSPFEGDAGDDARAQDPDDRDGLGGVGAEEEEDGRDDDEDEAGSQSDQGGDFGEVVGEGSHVEVRQATAWVLAVVVVVAPHRHFRKGCPKPRKRLSANCVIDGERCCTRKQEGTA